MVIEHYTAGARAVYERAAAQGRMLPEGSTLPGMAPIRPLESSSRS